MVIEIQLRAPDLRSGEESRDIDFQTPKRVEVALAVFILCCYSVYVNL